MDKIQQLQLSPDRSLVSIFKNGSIIYSKHQTVEFLKEQVLGNEYYSPERYDNKDNYYNNIPFFYNQVSYLNPESSIFPYFYYNLLENIRKKHHEEHGYSKLPSLKIYQLYSNPEYAKKYYCVTLPNQEFMNLYLDLMTNKYQKDKLDSLVSTIQFNKYKNRSNFSYYNKRQLKHFSTSVKNSVDKSSYYLKTQNPASLSTYYITLENIRKLYCRINHISDNPNLIEEDYDSKFIELFSSCINNENKVDQMNQLFDYVTSPLQMNYKNYKILELS